MDTTVLKISLAGLMHDLGKFVQDGMELPPDFRGRIAPEEDELRHLLYTEAFIKSMEDILPAELNSAGWGEGENFLELASGYHYAAGPLQRIVTEADRISCGLDRAEFEQGKSVRLGEYRRSRLLTLFEQLDLEGSEPKQSLEEFSWCYPLKPLSTCSIFPEKRIGVHSDEQAAIEYKQLYEKFIENLRQLADLDSVELWIQHFDSLLQTCTAMVPAIRAGNAVMDVSLYDHLRTTAAIAAALYLYHREEGTLVEEQVADDEPQKFQLISGDFYGIQDFIFRADGESAAYRSKLLRGRSFSVSLFTELAADMLCREMGLSGLSVVLNAAGKFTIIAPNTAAADRAVQKVRRHINAWLHAITYGQSSIGITVTMASPAQFQAAAFAELWTRHKQDMGRTKSDKFDLQRFGGVVEGYLDSFDNTLEPSLCPMCGVRPAQLEAKADSYLGDEGAACEVCRDHVMLGARLVKGQLLLLLKKEFQGPSRDRLLLPLFDTYQLTFVDESELARVDRNLIVKIWNTNVADDGTIVSRFTNRPINGYLPVYTRHDLDDCRLNDSARKDEDLETLKKGVSETRPKTFGDIARMALNVAADSENSVFGTAALGILKADVDRLGLLMSCGLPDGRYTISRMATLSRQLDSFFSIFLPSFLRGDERFREVYTVFAGGDDLFLIGPWNRMVPLACELREQFARFVCENRQLHFSAGVVTVHPHTPLDSFAEQAEQALEEAKEANGGKRNSITVYGETVGWEQLECLNLHQSQLLEWREKYLGGSIFYRFNEIMEMAAEEKQLDRKAIHISDMRCLRWRGQLSYQLNRNLNSSLKGEERQKALEEMRQLGIWLEQYGGALRIPLWSIQYDQRSRT